MLKFVAFACLFLAVAGQRSGSSVGNFPLTGSSSSGTRDTFTSSRDFGFGSSSSSGSSAGRPSSVSSSSGSGFGDDDTFDEQNRDLVRIDLWPNGVVPYEVAREIPDSNVRAMRKMFDFLESRTCVKFSPRMSADANFTYVRNGSGCSSPLGRSTRPQTIPGISTSSSSGRASGSTRALPAGASVVTMAPACFTTIRVGRRIMNLLGIPHETSRPDRDQFVEINPDNIRSGYQDNLRVYTEASFPPGVLRVPYDYQSITHYTEADIARNPGTWSIRPKPQRTGPRLTAKDLGGDTFSDLDIEKINAAYNCRVSGSRPSSSFGSFGSSSSTGTGTGIRRP